MKQKKTRKGVLLAALLFGVMAAGTLALTTEPAHAETAITSVDISGVTMPKEGNHPSISGLSLNTSNAFLQTSVTSWSFKRYDEVEQGISTDQYFEAGVPYTLTIAVSPHSGYTFSNNVKMTANGQELTNIVYLKNNGNILYGDLNCGMAQPLSPKGENNAYFANTNTTLYQDRSVYTQPLSYLNTGLMIESYASVNDWVGVAVGGQQGWIQRDDLSIIYDPMTAYALFAKVNTGAVTVRDGPSTSADRLGSLTSGTKVLTTGKVTGSGGDDWYTIDYKDQDGVHHMGFVMALYLTPSYDYYTALFIKSLPVFITAKSSAAPPVIVNGNEMEPEDDNIVALSNGTIQIKAIPNPGDSYSKLTENGVHLPSAGRWMVKELDFDASDQSVTVTLQSEWSYNTGNHMKILAPKLKAGKKKVTVTWKKDPQASGYHVWYSYKADMSNAKLKVLKGKKKTKLVIKNRKKGKRVYIQVRPYVKYGGTTYNGFLSKVKSAKVK